ncbi:MAG: diguanylate cyclase domain protein [Herminiimonas sp.]|nr:diguanylate cyclase domain protein [Herminiimonas sp.]
MLRSRLPFSLYATAVSTLLTGVILTVVLFTVVRRLENDAVAVDFGQRADIRFISLRQGLNDAVAGLEIVNQLFATLDSVNREQFHEFTQPLLRRYPYIKAFNFHRMVSEAERPAFEADMRKHYPAFSVNELSSDGRIVPVRIRDSYRVVDYLEPMKGNEAVFGFDAASYASQVDAMRRATDTGLPSATGLLRLMQETDMQRGFIVLMPVYRHGAALTDVISRRRAIIGDTAVVFRVEDLINKILNANGLLDASGIEIKLYAGNSSGNFDLAFHKGSASFGTDEASWLPLRLFNEPPRIISQSFDVAGQPWHMVISNRNLSVTANHGGSLLALAAGMLLSLLAAAYVQTLASRSQRIQRLVDERTAEARCANELLTEDIAARVRAEKALQLRQRAIEASANAIIITSAMPPDYPIEYVNPAFERMTGYKAEEVIGRSMRLLIGNDHDQPCLAEFKAATFEKREAHGVLRSYRKDGTLFWNDLYIAPVKDASGEVTHFVAAQYDITATKQYEAELEFQASHDTLTRLANRNLLRDRLGQAIAYASRYNHQVWAVFVDLDRFKFVNDTLGHKAGNLLLKTISARLRASVRATDTVARLGSDEFMLLLPERTDERLSTGVIQRIMDAVACPVTIDGHEFFLTCSVGVAVYPADGNDPDILIQRADIAMYRAKEMGRSNFQFYTPAMNEGALERLRIEGDLRTALERGEFLLYYQPQVDLSNGRIVGMEALIRWQHPQLGLISPARFIALAEETGLIVPIGAWVLRTACQQCRAWQRAGFNGLRIAVNLSARQFAQEELVKSIAAALEETGLAPHYLEIELTESLVMMNVERAIGILRELKAIGVQLSIDDFGTGYSSLSYLKRFPIDVLKIDQSFVRDITVDTDDAAIVALIISLAHSLRLQVIAEGVENEKQLAYLRHHGCDEMQGYYFSKPVPAAQFELLLRQDKRLPQIEPGWTQHDLLNADTRRPG